MKKLPVKETIISQAVQSYCDNRYSVFSSAPPRMSSYKEFQSGIFKPFSFALAKAKNAFSFRMGETPSTLWQALIEAVKSGFQEAVRNNQILTPEQVNQILDGVDYFVETVVLPALPLPLKLIKPLIKPLVRSVARGILLYFLNNSGQPVSY